MRTFKEFLSDNEVLGAVKEARSIMVIGGVDTGKTTLVADIARCLQGSPDIAICDLDVGQSSIGPPTTIGWGMVREDFTLLEEIHPEDIYFTGTLSPEGNLLPCITGAKIISQIAGSRSDKTIIDTTGYISGPPARVLKEYKIDLLAPDVVIGIEKMAELGPLLSPFSLNDSPRIFRVPVPPGVRGKTAEMRAKFRERRFRDYFSGAMTHMIPLKKKGLRFTRQPAHGETQELVGRIVSFRDSMNRDIALGIIEEVDRKKDVLLVATPLKGRIDFTTLVVGVADVIVPAILSQPPVS
jgi:polynucleotide 5'-hydroxyl-kinase GRC3/NOL9